MSEPIPDIPDINDPDYQTEAETLDEEASENARRSLRVVALEHAARFTAPTEGGLENFLENAEVIEKFLLGKRWRDKEV